MKTFSVQEKNVDSLVKKIIEAQIEQTKLAHVGRIQLIESTTYYNIDVSFPNWKLQIRQVKEFINTFDERLLQGL